MISFELFDDLFEPVIVLNENAEILYYNSSFLALFQMTPRTVLKLGTLKELFSELGSSFSIFLDNFLTEKASISAELTFTRNQQSNTVILKGSKLFDRYVLMIKDMTVEKQLYDKYKIQVEELKNSHEQILQADKLKALGEMSANISHEINNPLTVASGNNELLGFALESDDLNEQRENITLCQSNITSSLDRISKIISNMKDFLHKSEDAKEYINLHHIIENSIALLKERIEGEKVSVQVVAKNPDVIIMGNQLKLEQVVINLLSNALDALAENNTPTPSITIEILPDNEKSSVHLKISDNGPGIKKENREKIFQTFFTTKEVGKGTGLGLSISRRIIQTHQGTLELENSKTGASFVITLPSLELSNYLQSDWDQVLNDQSEQKKILFVDNEPQILNLCMSYLKNSPYLFLGATSAEEALNIIKRTSVHLIVTDLNMPKENGIDLIEFLRKKGIQTPALLLSGKEALETYGQVKDRLNISGMVLKPFTQDELFNTLKKTFA